MLLDGKQLMPERIEKVEGLARLLLGQIGQFGTR